MTSEVQVGDRVVVTWTAEHPLPGVVEKVAEVGPYLADNTIKVRFDDPLVYGGQGVAWVNPSELRAE